MDTFAHSLIPKLKLKELHKHGSFLVYVDLGFFSPPKSLILLISHIPVRWEDLKLKASQRQSVSTRHLLTASASGHRTLEDLPGAQPSVIGVQWL